MLGLFLISDNQRLPPLSNFLQFRDCTVKVALIGVRGLPQDYKKPVISVSIPGYEYGRNNKDRSTDSLIFPEDGSTERLDTFNNPNFLSYAEFHSVQLPEQAIFLPSLSIEVKDMSSILSTTSCFTQIPLIPYASWVQN